MVEQARRLRAVFGLLLSACNSATPRPPCEPVSERLLIPSGDTLLQPLCNNVYIEPGASTAEQRELERAYESAMLKVAAVFGAPKDAPVVVFCHSAACKIVFGAAPESASANDIGFTRDGFTTTSGFVERVLVVVTGPVPATSNILAHELVHARMKAQVSYDALPTWFNEGTATLIADEPSCRAHPPSSTFNVRELDNKQAWQDFIRMPGATLEAYCQARHEVSAWAEQFAEPRALGVAIGRVTSEVSHGGNFAQAYNQ